MTHLAYLTRYLFDLHAKGFYCVESGNDPKTDPRTGEESIELRYLLRKRGPKAWPDMKGSLANQPGIKDGGPNLASGTGQHDELDHADNWRRLKAQKWASGEWAQ